MVQSVEYSSFKPARIVGDGAKSIEDETLSGRVMLDNTSFLRCRFRRAVLVYAGGPPPLIRDCVFEGAAFEFTRRRRPHTLPAAGAELPKSSGLRDNLQGLLPEDLRQLEGGPGGRRPVPLQSVLLLSPRRRRCAAMAAARSATAASDRSATSGSRVHGPSLSIFGVIESGSGV